MLYGIWKIKYYNDIEDDDDDNDVMRCQEMSRHQEDIGGKKLFLETTLFGGYLKTWFLIMELTFPVGNGLGYFKWYKMAWFLCDLVSVLCLTLATPWHCSPPVSSVHGIFQARLLEWVAISFSSGSSQPRDWTRVSRTAGRCFTVWYLCTILYVTGVQ